MAKGLVNRLNLIFYKNIGNNWDRKHFRDEVLKQINPDIVILDLGAGAGIVEEMNFKGLVKKVYGVDPDHRVLSNPYLDEAFIGYGESMPMFSNEQFDLVVCCDVLEHLNNPLPFFKEVNRILKKGGRLLTKTPNKFHYVPLIAQITPGWFHKLFQRLYKINENDAFSTYYKVNSKREQIRIAEKTGFKVAEIRCYEGRPEYLRINFIIYIFGIIYERLVNLLHLDFFKVLMISKFQKE